MCIVLLILSSLILPRFASAAPFAVDTSTLYVSGGLVGVGTSSPSVTLDVNGPAQFGSGAARSTFTATGSLVLANAASVIGTSATFTASGSNIHTLTVSSGIHILAGGITWADNKTSTTSFSGGGGGGGALVSVSTTIPSTYPLNTTSNYVGLATTTFTTSGGRMMFIFSGIAYNGAASGYVKYRVLIDGADPNELGTGTFMATQRLTNSGAAEGQYWTYVMRDALSAGSHRFTFCARATAGSTHLDGDGGNAPQQFTVVDMGQ